MKPHIKDPYIIKDGKKISKVCLDYIDGDGMICDGCDLHVKCAVVVNNLTGDIMNICKECLQEMVDCFQ